jgi:5-methylcytosine-specific restriction endonuclease McrA
VSVKVFIDQRSKYPSRLDGRSERKKFLDNLHASIDRDLIEKKRLARKARKQEKKIALMTEYQRLRDVEQQFIEFRKKTAKKNKYPDAPQYKKGMGSDFYSTKEWRSLRWSVISKSNGCCSVCGKNNKQHGVILHVDHIKPRSKYPHLELDKNNLQVLCEACNLGKGARAQTF